MCPGSAGFRAKAWNAYMASCIPYPAQLCLPDAGGAMRLNACLKRAMGLEGWCPAKFIAGMDIAWGIQGAPRCPGTAAKGVGTIAWLKDVDGDLNRRGKPKAGAGRDCRTGLGKDGGGRGNLAAR